MLKFSAKLKIKVTRPCIHYSGQGMLMEFLVACKNLGNTWVKEVIKSQRLCKLIFRCNVLALDTLNVVLIFKRYTGLNMTLYWLLWWNYKRKFFSSFSLDNENLQIFLSRGTNYLMYWTNLYLLFLLMHGYAHFWHAHSVFVYRS